MESIIRNIIQEELRKALSEIYSQSIPDAAEDEDEIIYDFEAGRSFGTNKLARDISGLGEYYMNSYFPRSEMEENWLFEIEAHYGASQIIEITHKMAPDYKSYWKLDISELERGSDTPIVTNSTGFVKGYKNFIQKVNSTLEKEINPNLL
jgi:hypothetical protein